MWQAIARRKKEEQLKRIPPEWLRFPKDFQPDSVHVLDVPRNCGLLTKKDLSITEEYDATALAEAIRDREFTSVEVTKEFCKRAAIAQHLVSQECCLGYEYDADFCTQTG